MTMKVARYLLLPLLLVVSCYVAVGAQEIKCDFCGEVITGQYYTFESGLNVCKSCYDRSPKCALCGGARMMKLGARLTLKS